MRSTNGSQIIKCLTAHHCALLQK